MSRQVMLLVLFCWCLVFTGCEKKLSPGAEKCMSLVNEMKEDTKYKGLLKKIEYLAQACKEYTGNDPKNDGYLMKKMKQKCEEEGVEGFACWN